MSASGVKRVQFFRSLATLFNSGVGLHSAVSLLAEQENDPRARKVYEEVARLIASGRSMSASMAQFPDFFKDISLRLIAVGEKTGALSNILNSLAEHEERQNELRLKVRKALTLPAILCSFCLIIIVVFPPLVLGGILDMLVKSKVELPLITRILILLSDTVRSPIFYLALVVIIGPVVMGFRSMASRPEARERSMELALAVPVLGPALTRLAVARFVRALEILLEAGVVASSALKMAGKASGNPVLAGRIDLAVQYLESGCGVAESLAAIDFFPDTFLQTLKIGQESERMVTVLANAGRLLELEIEHNLEMLANAAEPFALAFIGGVVAFVVIATMLPMMELMKTL